MVLYFSSALRRELYISFFIIIFSLHTTLDCLSSHFNKLNLTIGMLVGEDDEEMVASSRFAAHMLNLKFEKVRIELKVRRLPMDNMFLLGSRVCDILDEGLFILFVGHSPWGQATLRSFCSTFHLPFITFHQPLKSFVAPTAQPTTTPSPLINHNEDYYIPNYDSSSSFDQRQPHDHYYNPPLETPTHYGLYTHFYMVPAVFDLMTHYAWLGAHYLYDNDDGILFFHELSNHMRSQSAPKVRIQMSRVSGLKDALTLMKRLDNQGLLQRNFLLNLPIKQCEQIIASQGKSPRGAKHSFILVNLGISELDTSLLHMGGIRISGFSLVDPNDKNVKKMISAWNNSNFSKPPSLNKTPPLLTHQTVLTIESLNFIASFTNHILLDHHQKLRTPLTKSSSSSSRSYFVPPSSSSSSKLVQMVSNTRPIKCDTGPPQINVHGMDLLHAMKKVSLDGLMVGRMTFDPTGMRKSYRLDANEISLNRGLAKIGVWYSEKGLSLLSPTIVRQKAENLFLNKTRVVTSIMSAPFLMLRTGEWTGNDRYEGYCADLTKQVADIIKFDFIIKPINDSKYGNNNSGTWDGMVGELLRGEADMAIAPLTITADRESVIDFSKPFMSLGISIMIKRPSKKPPSVFSFMNPLSYEVWMCVIFAYIGVSVVLFLVSRFSPFEWHVEDSQGGVEVGNNFTIFNSLWFSLGAFMQQGVDIEPRSMSGRIVGSVWWFFTLILISSYTANLAAFLTSERMQSPIESAEDLAKQTEIKYGTVDGGSTQGFFKKSTIPTYERMWAFMSSTDPWVFVKTADEGVAMVRDKNGKYAFLTESSQNKYTNQRKPCDTMKVGGNLDAKGYGIGTPMGSDLRDRITLAVLELIEKGELANLEKTWWYEKGECSQEGTPKKFEATSSLQLSNVAGVFFILVGGLVLSLSIAGFEYLYSTRRLHTRRRNLVGRELSSQEVFQQLTSSNDTL